MRKVWPITGALTLCDDDDDQVGTTDPAIARVLIDKDGRLQAKCTAYIIQSGTLLTAGQYIVTGTVGQPDAGVMSAGQYELLGGFWPGGPVCIVDFQDFARFAQYWRETGSDLPADLYKDDTIDEKDLREFCEEWLYQCPYGWMLR